MRAGQCSGAQLLPVRSAEVSNATNAPFPRSAFVPAVYTGPAQALFCNLNCISWCRLVGWRSRVVGTLKKDKGALALFHVKLGPFQVTMARFHGIRVEETGQNLNEGTQFAMSEASTDGGQRITARQ